MFKTNKINRIGQQSAALLCAINLGIASAEPLKTEIPANINIQSQPLGNALKQFATQTGKNIIFDKTLVNGKTAPPVKGNFGEMDALKRVLENSGLEAVQEEGAIVIKTARPVVEKKAENLQLDKVEVRAKRFYEVGPLPGLGLTKEQIPGNVQTITAKEIKESHSLSLTDLMNRKLQSVNVNDYQGNPFQMDLTYRGFTAGPQIGTPQGLSVFFDGIRVNEPFGDVVNWDMIPMNALAGIDVFPGSNPIFGRNTLGGALSMKTKDGFDHAGFDAQILTGSFGRKYLQTEAGWNNGTIGLFGAGNFFLEDGWRTNSPSKVNQFFGKASYRGDKLDLNLNTLLVRTELVGNGLVPSQMYDQDHKSVFTGEDTTKNKLDQFQLSGSYFVNDTFTITGQVYRRNSNRHALGADAYMDGFPSTQELKRNLNPGEEISCQFLSTNQYGIPDYYVFAVTDQYDISSNPLVAEYINRNGIDPTYNYETALASAKNAELSAEFAKAAREGFIYWSNPQNQALYEYNNIPVPERIGAPLANGDYSYSTLNELYDFYRTASSEFDPTVGIEATLNYFYDSNNVKHIVIPIAPLNRGVCQGAPADLVQRDSNGLPIHPDGSGFGGRPGVIDGIPTAVLTDNNIKQRTDGGSIQFNWNLDKHKLMVGASIDSAFAAYSNKQRFGLLDEDRKAFLAPDQILDMYAAADFPISNNDFSGTSTTKSVYASDTWSPIETLHLTAAARYNETQVKNTVATRTAFQYFSLGSYVSTPDIFNLCLGSAANCPSTGYRVGDGSQLLKPAETEKFSFYSINPSLGLSWQAKENLNFYINLAQGTRTPSVVELGCAYDGRPSGQKLWGGDKNGNGTQDPEEFVDIPNSIAQNRSCTLPTTLSGDPYLPQIKATTYDVGLRGSFGENIQWNLGAYQTDLRDDIYLVTVGAANSFFDTIGKTRRRGIEAGISGKIERLSFGINYSLTDATFESTFNMISDNNSSAVINDLSTPLAQFSGEAYKSITVKPGNRMPGIPLHNLNMNMSYDLTDKWRAGISAVMHSGSYLRGNENNQHRQGEGIDRYNDAGNVITSRVASNPGKVDGYAVFNFQTSYQISKEWSATLLVNNLFDKQYFTAGRLGLNPFSPSINGAIDRSGYNHNSDDWLSTNFLAPGAPRAAWISLRYQFVPD